MKKNEMIKKNKWILLVSIIIIMVIAIGSNIKVVKDTEVKASDISLSSDYFSEIPNKPDNFLVVQQARQFGVIQDRPEIDERYWKQVEWMPLPDTYLNAVKNVINTQYQPWWCVGIYDAQLIASIDMESSKGTANLTQRFWIRATPGSYSDLGVRLIVTYPAEKTLIGNARFNMNEMNIAQTPELAKKYISARILRVCSDSRNCEERDTFILGPTLPRLRYDYVKEVWFEVDINEDIPKGWYIVEIDVVPPSREYTSNQVWQHILSKSSYIDPNLGQSCGVPNLDFFIEVK